jgi:hypothetical protein
MNRKVLRKSESKEFITLKPHTFVLSRSSTTSLVDSTSTLFCCLSFFSSDQILHFSFNAKAKYSISLGSGETSLASDILSRKSSKGIKLILNLSISTKASNSLSPIQLAI